MDKQPKKFNVWPVPQKPDQKYGPTEKQRLLFIEDLPENERPHRHPVDVLLYVGGARSGKSTGGCARALSFMLKNPKAVVVVGATNFPLLQRTVLKEFQDRFTRIVPWDLMKDPNPILLKKPSQNDKRMILANGSQAYFLHFDNPEILRGIDADLILFEEASLLPDEEAFEELCRRLSGKRGKVRQLILMTNPTPRGGWINEKFKLDQLNPNFKGEKEPLCKPCSCHMCQKCLNNSFREIEYEDGVCPSCNAIKEGECPGNQTYIRVITTGAWDNQHIPEDYVQSQKAFMSEKTYDVFIGGNTDNIRDGFVYKAFEHENIFQQEEPISFEKDLIWTLDFNFEPQCSVICQEEETSAGFTIKVLDEIVLWNALPEHAAEEFCKRPEVLAWKEAGRSVLIYGDPAGLFGTGNNLAPSFYQIIYNVLTDHGFDARVLMRRPEKDSFIKEPVKIPVAGRIDAVNSMLKSQEDPPRMRLRINGKCKHLIRSLRELKFAEDGKSIDKRVDKNAQRKTDKETTTPLMTHPSDALGYYVYKRFPVLQHKKGTVLFQVPGESAIEYRNGKIYETDRTKKGNEIEKKREKRKREREQRKKERENSIRSVLREQGIWPSQGGSFGFFGYFY